MTVLKSQIESANLRNVSSKDHSVHVLFLIGVYVEDQFLYTKNKHKNLINNMFHFIPSYDNIFTYTRHKIRKNKIPC